MIIINLAIFFLILAPTWAYIIWLLTKRKQSPLYSRRRFKYLGYAVLAANLFWFSTIVQSQKDDDIAKSNLNVQEYAKIQEQKFQRDSQCSLILNSKLPNIPIKNLVVKFEPSKNYGRLLAIAYNDYLHLHSHEKKQFKQLVNSYTKSFCKEEVPFMIVDQLYNTL